MRVFLYRCNFVSVYSLSIVFWDVFHTCRFCFLYRCNFVSVHSLSIVFWGVFRRNRVTRFMEIQGKVGSTRESLVAEAGSWWPAATVSNRSEDSASSGRRSLDVLPGRAEPARGARSVPARRHVIGAARRCRLRAAGDVTRHPCIEQEVGVSCSSQPGLLMVCC